MATLYTHQSQNIAKTWALMTGFLVFVVVVAWLFSQAFGDSAILYYGIALALIMNVGSYWFSDKVVIAMTGAKPADPNEYRQFHNLVENIAITAGLPKPKVYVMNESQPNAFATGRDPEHAVVCATTGLLQMLNKTELEGVLAHELSHVGNRDMLVSTVAVVLAGFIAIISNMFMRSLWWGGPAGLGGGRRSGNDRGAGLIQLLALVAMILAPIAATLIQLAVSRKRELLADASGALLTRYPEGLINALKKISASPMPMRAASPATAHLFLVNPFKGQQAMSWMTKMFSTHPPITERIKALEDMDVS